MNDVQADAIAAWLHQQHETRQPFRIHEVLQQGGLGLAYDVQDKLVDIRCREAGRTITGYKIGLTTPRMQQMCGLDHPIAGYILSGRQHGSPAILNTTSYVRLGLECEVAVRLGRPLDGRNGAPSRDDIAAGISGIAAAFEIIEDRAADYKALDMASLIADNSWNAGMVLGATSPLVDLADMTGRLTINGVETDTGSTKDVLGHPLNSVAWLCEHLARRNARIEAGQWVMTGSIVPTRFPQAGDHYVFEIAGLPPVEARIAARVAGRKS